jgi:hypothetical protein
MPQKHPRMPQLRPNPAVTVAILPSAALCFVDSFWNGEEDGSAPDLPASWYRITVRYVVDNAKRQG